MVEIIRLYGKSCDKPTIPWKFAVGDCDSYWPVKWLLYPVKDGELWVVKRRDPDNICVEEQADLVGIRVDGELIFVEPEWNNEVVSVWKREEVYHLFKKVWEGEYCGVALEKNWEPKEQEEAEKWHRLRWVVRMLLKDRDEWNNCDELAFRRYVEDYYSKWLMEFKDLFDTLAKMRGSDRERFLENLWHNLEDKGFKEGFFMYVYWP
jgi:hypothetical protein